MSATREAREAAVKHKRRRWGRKLRNWFVGSIGPVIVSLWIRSLRLRFIGITPGKPGQPSCSTFGIVVFWHQRMLVLAGGFRGTGFRVLVSQHGDGEMIARVIEGLGMKAIRGSSTRGGARACLEILRENSHGVDVAITPDGPRGPRYVFQDGAIYLASRTGLPIYPVTVTPRRYAILPTWDGLILPCPFTAALVRAGEPIHVPPALEREGIETLRQDAERRLRDLTESTDRDFEVLYRTAGRV